MLFRSFYHFNRTIFGNFIFFGMNSSQFKCLQNIFLFFNFQIFLHFYGGKFNSKIAPVGHSNTHFLHSLHLVKSMYARLFSNEIASCGHIYTFSAANTSRTTILFAIAPFSLLMQKQKYVCSLVQYFLIQ